ELDDFSVTPYPTMASRALGTTQAKDVPFQVSKGALIALGQASMRSLYDLDAPLSVRYDLSFEAAEKVDRMAFYLALGICDDGGEQLVWAINLNSLQVYDASGWTASPETDSSFLLGKAFPLELRHDGNEAKLLLDGKQQAVLPAASRHSGAVFLRASTELSLR